ncbi:MAG: hypothetical protein VYB77_03150 [Planctomycetota bacterium]|nr:hypothetical protein [Planctomycetota bacterium]MED6306707.1 hypothetical protein [Planctomycetota bacterium]
MSDTSRVARLQGGDRPLRMQGQGPRARLPRKLRNPSPEELDRLILVAGELKPEWGTDLAKLRKTNQTKFKESVVRYRRLWHLVELQERNPALYELRLTEMKNGERLRQLADAYRNAVDGGSPDQADQLMVELNGLAQAQVDLQVRVRAEELSAMAEALEKLRLDMIEELAQRDELARRMVDSYLDGSSRQLPRVGRLQGPMPDGEDPEPQAAEDP